MQGYISENAMKKLLKKERIQTPPVCVLPPIWGVNKPVNK
jgi:hypothetical protein